jgi:hypothetical protein
MKQSLLAVCLLSAPAAWPAQLGVVRPFEAPEWPIPENGVDVEVLAALRKRGLAPSPPCSDEVFVRRAFLDVIGTLPEPSEVTDFVKDRRADKRAALIEALLKRDEFAEYWALKWCDLLRVKAEFPINLWPNAVQAYHHWIRDALRENRPLDRLAWDLLTSSGSNFRQPAVNFYRAIQERTPDGIAEAVALTFMGARTDGWPEEQLKGMAVFFSRVAYKRTREWKEEIVLLDPASAKALAGVFPGGAKVEIPPHRDPRQVFAEWLIAPDNPWFARSLANRAWSWLLGRGIIHEPDDIRPDNPPSNPGLLALLEKELVRARFDMRQLFRLILNSRTYQQSSLSRSNHPEARTLFAHYPARRLEAEVLLDALCRITGTGAEYSSPIPEPFTFIPEYQRTISLADGSISSPFLETFGRPARDTGLEAERSNQPSEAQLLHLLNSSDIQKRIERGPRLAQLARASRWKPSELIAQLFLLILSRQPTPEEAAAVAKYAQGVGLRGKQALDDLVWALINGKEFLSRH